MDVQYGVMAYIRGRIAVLVLAAIILLSVSHSTYTQQDTSAAQECLKVQLIAAGNRLTPKSSIDLVVRVHNLCRERIKFWEPHFPLFKVHTRYKDTEIMGDVFGGRILRDGPERFDNSSKYIEPKSRIQFVLNTNDIRWHRNMSSTEVLIDRFKDLEETDYRLNAEVRAEILPDSKGSRLISNSVFIHNTIY